LSMLSSSFMFIAYNFCAFLICSVRAACAVHLIHYTNHSGLSNKISFAFWKMFIKDNAVWETEQDKTWMECLQHMFSRGVLLTSCVLQYMFYRDVLLTPRVLQYLFPRDVLLTPCVLQNTALKFHALHPVSTYNQAIKTPLQQSSTLLLLHYPLYSFIPLVSPLTLMLKNLNQISQSCSLRTNN
jgi:hypothetical protein